MIFDFLCVYALIAIAVFKLLGAAYARHEQKRFNESVSEQTQKILADLKRLYP